MKELGGVGVALATPMNRDYTIDFSGLERLIKHVVDGGIDYIVVMGTTAEAPVLSWKEKLQVLEFVFEKTSEKIPVVFGHGGNHTFNLIERSKDLINYNIAAILSASPYYSRPSQEGILRHYQLLGDSFSHPIILYNVPSRTGSNLDADTTLTLAKHENIIGIKEASVDKDQWKQILKGKPEDFLFLSGNDHTTFEIIQRGGDGVISVVANLVTEQFCSMVKTAIHENFTTAKNLNDKLLKSYELSSVEGNPSSLKTGLEAAGICDRTVKPPLFDGSDELISQWATFLNS